MISYRSATHTKNTPVPSAELTRSSKPARDFALGDYVPDLHPTFTTRRTKYPDHQVEDIMSLWRIGHSAAEIGKRHKITRNAVIGLIHRMRAPLPTRSASIDVTTLRPTKPSPAPAKSGSQIMKELAFKKPQPMRTTPAKGVSFDALNARGCRFCVTTTQPYGFCGEQALLSKPYCEEHALIVSVKPRKNLLEDKALLRA